MKGFFLGVLGTVLAGVLVWLATDYAVAWKANQAQVIRVQSAQIGQRIIASRELIDRISKTSPGDSLTTFKFENSGRDDLENLSLIIQMEYVRSGKPITDIGLLNSIPRDGVEPKIAITDEGAALTYPLLRKGEGGVFWIRTTHIGDVKVRSNRKGLTIDEVSPYASDFRSGYISFWLIAFIAIASFLIGFAISELGNRIILRKIGFNQKDIVTAYTEASKKK